MRYDNASYRVGKDEYGLDIISVDIESYDTCDDEYWYSGAILLTILECEDSQEAEKIANACNSFEDLCEYADRAENIEQLYDMQDIYSFEWSDCLTPEQKQEILLKWKELQRQSY